MRPLSATLGRLLLEPVIIPEPFVVVDGGVVGEVGGGWWVVGGGWWDVVCAAGGPVVCNFKNKGLT